MKNNGKIAFMKFVFSIAIISFHLRGFQNDKLFLCGGSIMVDFFFLVSGFLFAVHLTKYEKIKKEELFVEGKNFIFKKIKSFFPYILFLCIISAPLLVIYKEYQLLDFVNSFYSLLYIPIKIKQDNIFGIAWYIIALIEAEAILFPIILKNKQRYINYICPLIILLLGGYIFINHHYLADPWGLAMTSRWGLLRAIFDVNVGVLAYTGAAKLSKVNFTIFSRICLTIIELFGYFVTFSVISIENFHSRFDIIMVVFYTMSIIISFSSKAYFNEILNNKIVFYLQKLSLPMYINQILIITIFRTIMLKNNIEIDYWHYLLYVSLISIAIAMIELKLVDLYNKNIFKIKRLFVKSSTTSDASA